MDIPDKMFGPLTFQAKDKYKPSDDLETKCLLCEDSFNLSLRLDIFLTHLFDAHRCVIEDILNIKKLPQYLAHWRQRLKDNWLESIVPSVKIDGVGNTYFLFSDLLAEDKEIRYKLRLEHVLEVQEFERTDKGYVRSCLFCNHTFEGTRQEFVGHLSRQHNLQLGNAQNLVFVEKLVDLVEKKLRSLLCVYCEKTFTDRNALKEHMRKKLHKRINPRNKEYDQFYVVNYLEADKNWRAIEKQNDEYVSSTEGNGDEEYSDWCESGDKITCLFCGHAENDVNLLCLHMDSEHDFDFVAVTDRLDFYQKVKLVNYVRKRVHDNKCPRCGVSHPSFPLLEAHMVREEHHKIPDLTVFDQPEFYFPTYEDDAFLYHIDDVEE
ncbi:zinc finger protein 277 [Cylas formicarius]|uniref:zinc finger protein 277 n=1 Tax=Cylas formicarius TaxID=197179 RepID=UPI002958DC06|nr:zinc finger protein 277 [Cylas formicarius]